MNTVIPGVTTKSISYSLEDGILHASYAPGIHITLEIARQIVEDRIRFTQNKSYPAIIDSQGLVGMDKEARDFLSSDEGIKGLKAVAIVVRSPFHSFLGNFFLWVHKTQMPVRLFSHYSTALKWLTKEVSSSPKKLISG